MKRNIKFSALKGMQKDMSKVMFNSDYAYDLKNVRISQSNEESLGSIITDKGNKILNYPRLIGDTLRPVALSGVPIGKAEFQDSVIVFSVNTVEEKDDEGNVTTKNKSIITKYQLSPLNGIGVTELYSGDLGFDTSHPIETLIYYENDAIQKVYWTDGLNSPRIINIAADSEERKSWNDNTFNFIRKLRLNEDVTIERLDVGGSFSPGTIQYVFTYFNLYGQESNIFYQSPLYYTSYNNRGADAEDKVSSSFSIRIKNVDTSFDYVRVYSIHRSSSDATPEVKKVTDIKIDKSANYSVVTTTKLDITLNKPVQRTIVRPGDDWNWPTGNKPVDLTNILGSNQFDEPKDLHEYLESVIGGGSGGIGGGIGGGTGGGGGTEPTPGGGTTPITIGDKVIINHGGSTITSSQGSASLTGDYITYIEEGYSINFIDNGVYGEIIDPTTLLYVGGEEIVFGTFTQKNNTLFLGNLELKVHKISDDVKEALEGNTITFKYDEIPDVIQPMIDSINPIMPFSRSIPAPKPEGFYPYENQLKYNSNKIKTLKYLETYRFGVQFQHITGKWSEAIWINDAKNTLPIKSAFYNDSAFKVPYGYFWLPPSVIEKLVKDGFVKARPVIVIPNEEERECVCQGVLCPTVYNTADRANGSIFAQSSWFFRPNLPFDLWHTFQNQDSESDDSLYRNQELRDVGKKFPYLGGVSLSMYSRGGIIGLQSVHPPYGDGWVDDISYGNWVEFRHNRAVPGNSSKNGEIQCIYDVDGGGNTPYLGVNHDTKSSFISDFGCFYYIDNSIVTLHSPDIEFNDTMQYQLSNLKLRIVGIVPITAFDSKLDITTSNSPTGVYDSIWRLNIAPGYQYGKEKNIGVDNNFTTAASYGKSYWGYRSRISNALWIDGFKGKYDNTTRASVSRLYGFVVYPWHRNGSLSNDTGSLDTNTQTSKLKTKSLLNYRYSYKPSYFTPNYVWNAEVKNHKYRTGISDVVLWNSNEDTIVKLASPANSGLDDIVYKGNINKILTCTTMSYNAQGISIEYDSSGNDANDKITNIGYENIKDMYPIVLSSIPLYSSDSTSYNRYPNGTISASSPQEQIEKLFAAELLTTRWMESVYNKRELGNNHAGAQFLSTGNFYGKVENVNERKVWSFDKDFTLSADPVSIKYKSTPHAILALNYSTYGDNVTLPTLVDGNIQSDGKMKKWGVNDASTNSQAFQPFWRDRSDYTVYQESLDIPDLDRQLSNIESPQYGWLWLGELYRDTILNKFGGQTQEAFENNMWVPSGEAVSIADVDEEGNVTPKNGCALRWLEGDTYFQRYDCMKTYPFTLEDQNQVTEILSFMCETRVNIDGRYDRNRGAVNFGLSPTNFNLMNPAYTQTNNFFVYRGLNTNKINLDKFYNQVTWTKTKTAGELVDTWTNITLASTLDLDGDKGKITKLENVNGSIISFQDSGISNILYDERAQISTVEGVPIEIGNSNKVTGKRYLSDTIGCQNKWSICHTSAGLYFIDDKNSSINLLGGDGIVSLSDKFGFHSWINNNSSSKIWDPVNFNNFTAYYDNNNDDILFIGKDTCLAYSETLGQFSSFYSYDNTPYILNLEDKTIMVHKDNSDISNNNYYLWEHGAGKYNEYFGKKEPFSITVIANDKQSQGDNIFDTIDLKADTYHNSSVLSSTLDIKELSVWNEYQEGTSTLVFKHGIPTNLKKKFRIWRMNIPRNNNSRDRMRNPWLAIKLTGNTGTDNMTIVHDINVNYFSN